MSKQWHGGKGSSRRKDSNADKYGKGWDRIYGTPQETDAEEGTTQDRKSPPQNTKLNDMLT